MARKMKAPARRAPVKRKSYRRNTSIVRQPRMDGQSILVSAYFEASKTLSAAESVMAYSLCIDPKQPLVIKGAGVNLSNGAQPPQAPANDLITLSKWTTFKGLFNQYRINSASVTVRVDGKAGLEHPVICCTDKGDDTTISSMAQAMGGAHKSYSMTTSRRELKYGCKSTGQELDFYSTNDNQDMSASEKKYLKIFQKLPAEVAAGDTCEHQIQVLLSLTLKDSKNIV